MNIVKKVISITSLTALIASFSLNAQTPEGSVNAEGQLVLPDMDPIDPPAGSVDAEGNLVINGTTIPKPVATVNADGSLTTPDGDFQVPAVPVTVFLTHLYEYPGTNGDAWYSPWYGDFWISAGGWIYWENFRNTSDGWMYVHTVTGSNDGFWAFHNWLDTWVYISNQPGAFAFKESPTELQASAGIYILDQGWGTFWEEGDNTAWWWGPTDTEPTRVR